MTASKIVAAAASGVGGAGLDIDEVFSIDLWDGTGRYSGSRAEQTITNGIDFSTNGGMVYIKGRGTGTSNGNRGLVFSTPELGLGNFLYTAHDYAKNSNQTGNTYLHTGPNQYNTDGFKLGDERDGWGAANDISTPDYVGYSFRKAKKFFDVVAYTGNGSTQDISHSLGSTPGMIWIKKTSSTSEWFVWHTGVGNNHYLLLNTTAGKASYSNWLNPTSTTISLQNDSTNNSGATYVAYFFAHNNNDGGFGPDSDQDIIKCGSYTGNSTDARTINLGFEAQWLLVKRSDGATDWWIVDSMRGLHARQISGRYVEANTSNTEASQGNFFADSQGFMVDAGDYNTTGETYIYMAIRRGPLAVPEDATKVFKPVTYTGDGTNGRQISSSFVTDMTIGTRRANQKAREIYARLTSNKDLETDSTSAEGNGSVYFDTQDGILVDANYSNYSGKSQISWMWKRAPGYFDVVAYTGTGSARDLSHNLGVVPEMYWIKSRDETRDWIVYANIGGTYKELLLNTTSAASTASSIGGDPTASVIKLGSTFNENRSGFNYIAYLFATVAGVSKVGSFSHTSGQTQNIDCGFSSGARFVLVKQYGSTGNWFVYDTARGIVSGNDPRLQLNTTAVENTANDDIDPLSSGFTLTTGFSGGDYIFYAIA